MVKSSDHGMEIGQVRLVEKSGGTSGDWTRENG
jgi:molybdenum cofactor biosynthesis enzyme